MKKLHYIIILALVCVLFISGCDLQLFSPPKKELTRGTIEGNSYTSDYAEISFSAPDDWVYATDEEIAKIMGLSADMFAEAGLEFDREALKKSSIYDTMVQNPATGSNIVVLYENLLLITGETKMTEEQYIDNVINQFETAQIYKCVFSDIKDESLCGNQYKMLRVEMPDYNAFQYFLTRKVDKYMLSVIISVFGDDDISSILNFFA